MKRDTRDDKPRLGHASKYINSSKEKDKDTPSKSKSSKPYAGEGGLKKLLARRKREAIEAESVESPDMQVMVEDNELEPEPELPKRTSKIAEPVRSPATFARKVSAPPPSFVSLNSRKPAHFRTSRARTVGPTRTRNRFTAAYEDDELDGADDLAAMPEEPPKEKESISASLPKFEPPSGFSFAPVRLSSAFDGVYLTFPNSHPLLPRYLRFPIRHLFAMSRLSVLFPSRSPSPQCRRS